MNNLKPQNNEKDNLHNKNSKICTMKTAVEFFEGVLRNLAFDDNHHLELGDIRITQGMIDYIARQSKAMEKQQIKQAYIAGYQRAKENKDYKESEHYYNETYEDTEQ